MTAITKASAKSYFETGDKPTQVQFGDLIDSYQDYNDALTAIATSAQAGNKGIPNITASAAVTLVSAGTVGLQILTTTTTAAATNILANTFTWTPAFSSTSATFSHKTQVGEGIKIGDYVFLEYRIAISAAPGGTTSNALFITGIPNASKTNANLLFGGHIGHYFSIDLDATESAGLVWQMGSNSTQVEVKGVGDNTGEGTITASQLQADAEIRGTIAYIAG